MWYYVTAFYFEKDDRDYYHCVEINLDRFKRFVYIQSMMFAKEHKTLVHLKAAWRTGAVAAGGSY